MTRIATLCLLGMLTALTHGQNKPGTPSGIALAPEDHRASLGAAVGSGPVGQNITAAVRAQLQAPHHRQRLLVRFKAGTDQGVALAAHNTLGARPLKAYRHVDNLHLIEVAAGDLARALDAYSKNPNVLYAEPNYVVQAHAVPNDVEFDLLWGLRNTGQTVSGDAGMAGADIRAVAAWDLWTGDPDFRIAVIDTGVNHLHPDLAGNMWTNQAEKFGIPGVDDDGNGWVDDIHGYNTIDDNGDAQDDRGHGTHVAGTIGAVGNNALGVVGVNWRCQIVALKFLGTFGFGLIEDAIEAMEYVIDNQIRVSNNSWGCLGQGCFSQAMADVIASAQSVGHIFVASAGNGWGNDNDLTPIYPSSYDLSNIIAVAATDNDDNLAALSSVGPTTVDLGAPGILIHSTTSFGGYGFKSGTSMAAPHVSGVVALVAGRFQGLSWQEVRDVIFQTVRPIDSLSGLTVTGGVVDAAAALGDCNGNGIADDQDIIAGTSLDCSGNSIPDECEGDCNGNGVADSCDVIGGTSDDCNSNEVPDECEPRWDQDCDGDTTSDLCELGLGSSDCNSNHIPDECESPEDCNANGVQDICDLAGGTAEDFNRNGVLDECEAKRVLQVDDDAASDPGPGDPGVSDPDEDGSLAHPFDAIQEAIDDSISGDQIELAVGVYNGLGNRDLDFGGRSITLRSVDPDDSAVVDATIIDCEQAGRGIHFHNAEGRQAKVLGLTIRNGSALGAGVPAFAAHGGAIYCVSSNPTIAKCVFEDNWALDCFIDTCTGAGGGIYNLNSDPLVTNCVFKNNRAGGAGGGMFNFDSSPTIANTLFVGNRTQSGMDQGVGLKFTHIFAGRRRARIAAGYIKMGFFGRRSRATCEFLCSVGVFAAEPPTLQTETNDPAGSVRANEARKGSLRFSVCAPVRKLDEMWVNLRRWRWAGQRRRSAPDLQQYFRRQSRHLWRWCPERRQHAGFLQLHPVGQHGSKREQPIRSNPHL